MALPAQDLAEDGRTVAERARPVAHEGRAVHGGEGLRLERRQVREDAVRHRRVGQVVRERPHLVVEERVTKAPDHVGGGERLDLDRKSTRLNSSHTVISYAVCGLKKKTRSARS